MPVSYPSLPRSMESGVADITSRTHHVTQYRLDAHNEVHPDHEQREVTGVADRWATWICSCGAVFRVELGDEEILQAYWPVTLEVERAEVEIRRLQRIATVKRVEALAILARIGEPGAGDQGSSSGRPDGGEG